MLKMDTLVALRAQIDATESTLAILKAQLARLEAPSPPLPKPVPAPPKDLPPNTEPTWRFPLRPEEYRRYGRQLIMPEVGLQGQLRLRNAKVLIVGLGGLGSPASAYLAGAGVGTIGLVDGDTVEESNLHRQIVHSTERVGMKKVDSAAEYLRGLNPTITLQTHPEHITPTTVLGLFSDYDLVLDCTDHPTSRYLISDACVLLGKPLVSASALRTDGQLMVLNDPALPQGDTAGGPCYRCVFPKPPPPESVISCGEGGILGPVVGVMGVLQALEAIKLIARRKVSTAEPPSLLIFSGMSSTPFRSVRLRSRRPKCAACSAVASINNESLLSGSLDYVQFCGVVDPVKALKPDERVSGRELNKLMASSQPVIVDVREKVQFDLCNLPDSINVPWSDIVAAAHSNGTALEPNGQVKADITQPDEALQALGVLAQVAKDTPMYVICRQGNDSQLAVRWLQGRGFQAKDVRGGFIGKGGWKEEVDSEWPIY